MKSNKTMEKRKIKSHKRYFLSFVIATIVFIIGFLITNMVAFLEYQKLTEMQNPTYYNILETKLKYTLLNEDLCSESGYIDLTKSLGLQGQIIGDLETKFGKNDPQVLFEKQFYSLLQMEHLEFINYLNEKCNKKINVVLFFYSNNATQLEESVKMGDILGTIYYRNKEVVAMYSLDLNLKTELIQKLKEKYNIGDKPTVILNEEHRFEKIKNLKEIESLLIS